MEKSNIRLDLHRNYHYTYKSFLGYNNKKNFFIFLLHWKEILAVIRASYARKSFHCLIA